MYAAPLNLDRFFRKVFCDKHIAKSFLEDFLGTTIEEIELIPIRHKITDGAALVEFDFRCKINGQYIIIDMQQWYKPDVVKRFYVYQALNSCLQLETLPKKETVSKRGKKYEVKDYSGILPTITLIWMADDTLKFETDMVSFALSPAQAMDFIKNEALWSSKDFEKISTERQKILTLLNNKSKELNFLPQNRLIFAFQKNIIKNPAFSKYKVWFEFAETTKNRDNKEEDFVKFKKYKPLMAVLERIKTEDFQGEDKTILEEWESDFIRLAEYWSDLEDMKRDFEVQKQEVEVQKQYLNKQIKEVKHEALVEGMDLTKEKTVLLSHQQGLDNALIATITQLTIEKVKDIIQKNKGA